MRQIPLVSHKNTHSAQRHGDTHFIAQIFENKKSGFSKQSSSAFLSIWALCIYFHFTPAEHLSPPHSTLFNNRSYITEWNANCLSILPYHRTTQIRKCHFALKKAFQKSMVISYHKSLPIWISLFPNSSTQTVSLCFNAVRSGWNLEPAPDSVLIDN